MKDVNKYRSLLIITFFFAPCATVGAKRFSFLTYHFSKKINVIHILTSKIESSAYNDKTIPFRGKIHFAKMFPRYTVKHSNLLKRILTKLWVKYLCIIDPYSGWIIPAIIKGLKIIKKNNIDIIICTGPPFSVFLIGLFLKIRTKVKLICDYRDPWSNQKGMLKKGYLSKINKIIEKYCIRRANALVFSTNMMKEDFEKCFGDSLEEKCYVLSNGYEPSLYTKMLNLPGKKKIIYSGEFYGDRRLKLFVDPINKLIKKKILDPHSLRFHIFGTIKNEDREIIKKNKLNDIFVEHTPVNYLELLSYLRSADILLLIISEDMSYSISYKFFDYLGSNRPILAVVPKNSEMVRIMKDVRCGRFAYIDNKESIYENLRILLEKKNIYKCNDVERYQWSSIATKYISLINEVSKLK